MGIFLVERILEEIADSRFFDGFDIIHFGPI
jgi:hypothetical protein